MSHDATFVGITCAKFEVDTT